jgi:predicted secreted hydrolase
MKRRSLAAAAVVLATGWALVRRAPPPAAESATLEIGPDAGRRDFARATEVRTFTLPADHGPHHEFETEWWYFTGNLEAEDGRAFGYQLTFFRRGLHPGLPPGRPGLSTSQIYFAHLALTDVDAGTHQFEERWSRGWEPLAGSRAEPFGVWLEDWRVDAVQGDAAKDAGSWRLRAALRGRPVDLLLTSRKPLVLHGDRGLSPKSGEAGNASYYIGYTRLETEGTIAGLAVRGDSWFDHEWSTSALGPGAVGWDWWSLQLDDGRELMYFRIRRTDGSVEPVSGGTLVEASGRSRRLLESDVRVEVLDRWTSPESGAVYPSRWRIEVPKAALVLEVEPRLPAQEMRTSFTYWEGAVGVEGSGGGRPLAGRGYVELTGYAGTMQGVF